MSVWAVPSGQDHIYTVVYLLRDALQAACAEARHVEQVVCAKPEMRGANVTEVHARLGRFRESCKDLKTREGLLLTKLSRARQWARELKDQADGIEDDVDQFLDATSGCDRCVAAYVPDAQSLFNGGFSAARFLAERGNQTLVAAEVPSSEYQVGGSTPAIELRVACEVFLSQIEREFFTNPTLQLEAPAQPPAFLTYLQAAENATVQGETAAVQ
jgi:hypothetical protein